jgi:hypothetical protein
VSNGTVVIRQSIWSLETTINTLRESVTTAHESRIEVARQQATLWSARMNMALAVNDADTIRNLIRSAGDQNYLDNNCQCGGH